MAKKIRIVPTLLIMLITAVALFGGWAFYERSFVKQPVERVLKQHAEITQYDVKWDPDILQVKLKTKNGTNISSLVEQVSDELQQNSSGKKIQLEYWNEQSTPNIDQLWSRAMFDVAEAMVHQKYSSIPVRLKELQQQHPGIQIQTEMDARYVYIQLKDGQGSKTILLPLQASPVGVWPNEKATAIRS
ncbi:quinolinate synthase [Paenibacillus alvei]|nr:quinolinate synthase [Paenibacillus alvei]